MSKHILKRNYKMYDTYVLYHKDCLDGIAAAWAAWKYFGDKAGYIAVQYGEMFPAIEPSLETEIYIVDFSYPRQTLLDIKPQFKKIQIIDHHKTAKDELQGLDFAIFDMSKSGAVLTWEHFFPNILVPELLLYVQDRDLWAWTLPYSRKISAALQSYPKSIREFNELVNTDFSILAAMGTNLLRNTQQIVDSLAQKAEINYDYFGTKVPILNSSTLQSELGEKLLQLHPTCPFAAVYFYTDLKTRVWSLRSRQDDFDVSALAKSKGGGGHPGAAGFKENLP